MAIDNNFYKNKKIKDFYFSLGFLLFTLIITISLFAYNSSIKSTNEELKLEIERINKEIISLEEKKNKTNNNYKNKDYITAYNIYSKNTLVFDMLAKKSQIPSFIRHLRQTYRNYNIKFTWFSYSNGVVSTSVNVETDKIKTFYNDWKRRYPDMKLAYMKIINFLNLYNNIDNNLFRSGKVTQFSWYDNMSFNVVFELK